MLVMNVDVSGINEIIGTFEKMPDKLEKARDYAISKTKPILATAIKKGTLGVYNISEETLTKKMLTKQNNEAIEIIYQGRVLSPLSFEDATPRVAPMPQRDTSKPYKKYIINGQWKTLRPQMPYEIKYSIFKGKEKTLYPQTAHNGKSYKPFLMRNINASGKQSKYFIALQYGNNRKDIKGVKAEPPEGVKTLSIPQMILHERVAPNVQQKAMGAFMRYFANRASVLGAIDKEQKNAILRLHGIKVRGG